jgi:hypothetical protein
MIAVSMLHQHPPGTSGTVQTWRLMKDWRPHVMTRWLKGPLQTGTVVDVTDDHPPPNPRVGVLGRILIGITLALVGVLSVICLVWAWDGVEEARGGSARIRANLLGFDFTISPETSLFLLIFAAAAVGSFVHAATSFVTYAGNRTLRRSWIVWYFFRTLIGIALATVVYLVVRAGFFASASDPEEVSPFGVAAIAGLTGLFSKQATDKLQEVFDVIFRTAEGYGDSERVDKAEPQAFELESVQPDSYIAGNASAVPAVVTGRGFVAGSKVFVDDKELETQFLTSTQLTFQLSADQMATPGILAVVVQNPTGERTRSFQVTVQGAPTSS